MKKVVVFLISVVTSLVFIFWLSACGSSASTKLGMSKDEVKKLYDEAPTYEHNNTYYWGDDDFINLLKKYDYELGENPTDNYQVIVNAMNNAEFKSELNELSFRFRFARFDDENKLSEFYYDFTHKFDLEDDYSSSLDKQVKEINLSKSKLDYYITEGGQWKNNKNKVIFKAELVDFDNISYTVEFEDGTIYKGYLKNSLTDGTLDEFVLNKNSKKYEMFLYVNTEMNNANFNDLTDEISTKISFALRGKCLSDEYKIDLLENSQGLFSGLFSGRCVGYIGGPLTKDGKYTIYKWNTKISYLPDNADINSFTGQMTQKIWKNVIYQGYTLNPYYKVVGVQDPNKPSYEIEDGAVIIGENAFSNLSLCYKIELPETVVEVEKNAIVNDINLVSIYIPESVEVFDRTNLSNCPKILEIVSGSKCVTEEMYGHVFQNGAGFFYDAEDYSKGFICGLDYENKFIVAEIKGSNTYFNDYNYDGYYIVGTIKLTSNISLPETLRFKGKTIKDYKIFKYAFATNSTINSVNVPSSVSEIREQAFYGCKNLETITANSVTSIYPNAFSGCTNLKNISFNSLISIGDNAFEGCVKLTNLELNKVQTVCYNAFTDCTGLTDVNLPNLVNLYPGSFKNCTNLETFNAPYVTSVSDTIFENCSKLANLTTGKLSHIGYNAFNGCSKLTAISIVDSNYLYIDDNAFNGSGITFYKEDGISYLSSENNKYAYLYSVDSNKESVVIKNDVLCVRVQAFYNLSKLKSLTVQDNIEFYNLNNLLNACSNLTFKESNGAKYIGSNNNPYLGLVSYDKTLSTCNINSNTKFIMNNAFENTIITSISFPSGLVYLGANAFSNCDYLTSVTLPQGLNSDWGAFSNCDGLEEVSIYGVGYGMFANCKNLRTVNSLNDIYNVYDESFMNCTSLETIDLSKCTYFGYNSFKNCSSLSTANLTSASTIYNSAFEGCRSLTTISLPNIYELFSYAFKNCTYLENVELGENLAYIGDGVFEGCSRLKDLVLPDRVVNIGYGIVNNCSKLAKIAIPKEVFGYITNALGNVVNDVDVYVKNSYEELEELGFKLSYLELNQRLYIYSETEPEDGPATLKYWHYDTNGKIAIWA